MVAVLALQFRMPSYARMRSYFKDFETLQEKHLLPLIHHVMSCHVTPIALGPLGHFYNFTIVFHLPQSMASVVHCVTLLSVQLAMPLNHVFLGRPLPCFPSTLPCIMSRDNVLFCLVTWPSHCSFNRLAVISSGS